MDGQNGSHRSRFRICILSNMVSGLVEDRHQGYSGLICFPTIQTKNRNVLPVWFAPPPSLVSSLAWNGHRQNKPGVQRGLRAGSIMFKSLGRLIPFPPGRRFSNGMEDGPRFYYCGKKPILVTKSLLLLGNSLRMDLFLFFRRSQG